jgi:hypothetical protein
MGAMLHDVGKVATSDLILKKPAQLSFEEFEIMKQHTIHGARLFSNPQSDYDEAAAIIALNHHEKWDGTGYPATWIRLQANRCQAMKATSPGPLPGKRGKEIPIFGRIVAIADVYDALSPQSEATKSRGMNRGALKSSARAQAPILIRNWWKFSWNRLAFIRAIQIAVRGIGRLPANQATGY